MKLFEEPRSSIILIMAGLKYLPKEQVTDKHQKWFDTDSTASCCFDRIVDVVLDS